MGKPYDVWVERGIFRMADLDTDEEIDRHEMSLERSVTLNNELREAGSPYRWLMITDDPGLQLLFG